MFKTRFHPFLSIKYQIEASERSGNKLRVHRNKRRAKRFSKQGEFLKQSRTPLFGRRTVLKENDFDLGPLDEVDDRDQRSRSRVFSK